MTYTEFQPILRSGKFPPIILFHGDEDFLIEECVDAIIDHVVDPAARGFNLDVIYGSKADPKDVVSHASSFPMMGEKRVVLVKEFEKLVTAEASREIVSTYIDKPLDSTILLLVSLDPDLRRKPFTDLKKKAMVVECRPLYDNQVPTWIAQRIKGAGKEANAEACRLLQAYVGNSLRALQNEIDKLFVFIGEKKVVTHEDVAAVVGASKGFTVFELQNAIGRKDTREAVRIVERMVESGQAPQMMIVMLTRFFLQLWKLSDPKLRRKPEGEIASEIGIPPYFLKQQLQFQANFTVKQVENALKALLEADRMLKSTSPDPHVLMDLLIIALINGSFEHLRVPA